jgi:hypothetical protein
MPNCLLISVCDTFVFNIETGTRHSALRKILLRQLFKNIPYIPWCAFWDSDYSGDINRHFILRAVLQKCPKALLKPPTGALPKKTFFWRKKASYDLVIIL